MTFHKGAHASRMEFKGIYELNLKKKAKKLEYHKKKSNKQTKQKSKIKIKKQNKTNKNPLKLVGKKLGRKIIQNCV